MKNFIKSLELRWSDLFLLLGMIPFAVLLTFGQLFMQYPNPDDVALPLWAAIICIVSLVGLWGYYLYLEVYRSKEKFNLIIPTVLLSLVLLNVVAIAIQPAQLLENVIVRASETNPESVGTVVPLVLTTTVTHKVVFISELIAAALMIYIGLFVFPKRFKSLTFLRYLGYGVFAFLVVLIVYGYIFEFDKYVGFFKYILGIDRTAESIYPYTVKSFILHRNAYGMMMMLGIIFAFINHSIEKKWWYYLIAAFCYINMIFSLCKTGLLISALGIIIYIYYRLIVTYKENNKRNKIGLISISSILALGIALVGISYVTKGKILGFIYGLVSGSGGTLDTRSYIWDNSYQLLQDGWWVIGRGFGIYNLFVMPMNTATHEDPVFPAHSAYLGLLAEGGILFLLAYLCLLGYMSYIVYKCLKKNPSLTLAMSLGAFSFILYSFIETIHYFVYVFFFPIMVLYHTLYEKEEA